MRMGLGFILVAVLAAEMLEPSLAQTVTASAPVPDVPGKATSNQLAAFKADPQSLLRDNPIGGLRMSFVVKALTLADPIAGANLLLSLASSTNANPPSTAQLAAIGAGLGQAVTALQSVDKPLADQVAQLIGGSKSTDLLTAYNTATASPPTLSVGQGVGGPGVGGGVGGAVVTGTGPVISGSGSRSSNSGIVGTTGNSFVANTVSTNFSGGLTGASVSLTGGSTTTCTSSVSPRKTC